MPSTWSEWFAAARGPAAAATTFDFHSGSASPCLCCCFAEHAASSLHNTLRLCVCMFLLDRRRVCVVGPRVDLENRTISDCWPFDYYCYCCCCCCYDGGGGGVGDGSSWFEHVFVRRRLRHYCWLSLVGCRSL